jgi:uncharacterized membrane protein YeiH
MVVVEKIFKLAAGGLGTSAIQSRLYRENIPSPRGGRSWQRSFIKQMVMSDIYYPHTCEEITELVSAEVASRLDPSGEYGIRWWNRAGLVILAAAGATLAYGRFFTPPRASLLVADAFGLAVFTFIGAQTAHAAGAPSIIVVLMGTITGAAGGVMRDVLCAEVPLILRREVYATASIAGGAVYVLLEEIGTGRPLVAILSVGTVFILRLAAIRFDLHVPPFPPKDGEA